jgi:hypothetical protein
MTWSLMTSLSPGYLQLKSSLSPGYPPCILLAGNNFEETLYFTIYFSMKGIAQTLANSRSRERPDIAEMAGNVLLFPQTIAALDARFCKSRMRKAL